MFTSKDKLYLETSDLPTLKEKIDKAIKLSNELSTALNDLNGYSLEFELKNQNKS
ncbi:MAG: hypothetical protein IJH12_07040 [Clostridia bacterium]|nr:hypothetical protein [Clostridia bacterium]